MSKNRVLVITYHAICEGPPPLCQAPEQLEDQLDLLARCGYRAQPLAELVDALLERRELPADAFALTFDDAYRDFTEVALPILERRGVPATLFTTASSDRDRLPGGTGSALVALEELRELARRGVAIGAHSIAHTDLTQLDDAALKRELVECRQILEAHSGGPVHHFAYPFGRLDARVRGAVAEVFRSACTTRLARVRADSDPLAIPRVDAYYLRSPLLRSLLERGRPDAYLGLRRALRRLRGSEPRGGGSPVSTASTHPLAAGG